MIPQDSDAPRPEATFTNLESDIEDAIGLLMQMSLSLGRWHATHQDRFLREMIDDAADLRGIACRIKRLAQEQAEQP